MAGTLDMTVGEIQGSLRQILEDKRMSPLLSSEQRYSLVAAMESMEFLKRLSPGLKKVMEEHRNETVTSKPRTRTRPRTSNGKR